MHFFCKFSDNKKMAEDTPPWLIEQGDYIYESIELLLPVFHKVKFSPLQSARVSTLVKLCSKKIVADSSMCQQARFLLPATLIEGLGKSHTKRVYS